MQTMGAWNGGKIFAGWPPDMEEGRIFKLNFFTK